MGEINNTQATAITGALNKVKVTSSDSTANYLESKLVAGLGLTITKQNAGANENLKLDILYTTYNFTADETITAGKIVRRTATGIITAQADSAANATSVIGVVTANVSSGASGTVACGGFVTVDLGAETPVLGSIVYLSAATAGLGTQTAPTSGAGRQIFVVGKVVKLISGSICWVHVILDRAPVTA